MDDDKFQHDIEFQSKVNKWLEFWNFQLYTQVIHQILATNSKTSVKGRLYYLYLFNEKECPIGLIYLQYLTNPLQTMTDRRIITWILDPQIFYSDFRKLAFCGKSSDFLK